jgi:hypothetical protein
MVGGERVSDRGEGGRLVKGSQGSGGGGGHGRDPFVIPVNLDPGQGCPGGGEGVNFLVHKGFNYGAFTKRGIMDGEGRGGVPLPMFGSECSSGRWRNSLARSFLNKLFLFWEVGKII